MERLIHDLFNFLALPSLAQTFDFASELSMYNYDRANQKKATEVENEARTRLEERATKEWSRLAGEPVRVEDVGGTLYAYGSCLPSPLVQNGDGEGCVQLKSQELVLA